MKKPEARNDMLVKIARFCAYQERSRKEVYEKALALTEDCEAAEKLLLELEEEGYINQSRFIESFIRGKFQSKKWGRIKIHHALKNHDISEEEILAGFKNTIDEEEYEATADELVKKKIPSLRHQHPLQLKQKVFHYMLSKGFESDVVLSAWKKLPFNV